MATHSTVTYKRVFRFPAALVQELELGIEPVVPRITKPTTDTPGANALAGGGGGGGGGGGKGKGDGKSGSAGFGGGGGGAGDLQKPR